MIFDSAGNLVWFHREANGFDAADLRTQALYGHTVLTWWQGRTVTLGFGLGYDVITDAHYHTVGIVRAGNGLLADEHEFTITPQGVAYVDADSPVKVNLRSAGGSASGIALDGVVQEIDIRTGLVMWEWHSLGHVALSESYSPAPRRASTAYDYFHLNSLEADAQGNLLVSARNTSSVYEINQQTGAVSWRLGGKRSTFALGPGVAFAYQHDASWLADGDISVFDDEGAPPVKPPSRGEVIHVDPVAKTATLVSQFARTIGPLATASQGNLQELPDGGWLVGWGGLPNITEFNALGETIYDAQLPAGEESYRVYRLPWQGEPASSPAIAAIKARGATTVYASWNGATEVAEWQLLAGGSAARLASASTVARSGFETAIGAPTAGFYQVKALGAEGRVLGSSRVVSPAG
jgi:Arylsulfotransferase (ASST)